MKNKVYVFIISLTIISIYGCSGLKMFGSSELESSQWQLDTLNGKKVTIAGERQITLIFDKENGKISGFGGCNSYFGNYLKDDNKLKFFEIGSTKMACDELETESAYFSALAKVDKYKINNKILYFYSVDSQIVVMKTINE